MLANWIYKLTRATLRYRWLTIGLSAVIFITGIFAITRLQQELLPEFELPRTVVLAYNPGLDLVSLRDKVTIPLEDAAKKVEGVVNVESTTSQWVVVLIVRYDFGQDQDTLQRELQAVVTSVSLPPGVKTPVLYTFDFSDLPVVSYSLSSTEISIGDLRALVEAEVMPELAMLLGVGEVTLSGGQELPAKTLSPPPTPQPTPEATSVPVTGTDLPYAWTVAAGGLGIDLEVAEQVTPQVIQAIATAAPDLLGALEAEHLLAFNPQVLAWLPTDFVCTLDVGLRIELAARAESYGGLSSAYIAFLEAAAALAAEAPHLSGAWQEIPADSPFPQPETAAELIYNGLGLTAAGLLNTLIEIAPADTASMLQDLTPEVVLWLAEKEVGFLVGLAPATIRMLSPEVLLALPETFYTNLEPTLRQELEDIAAGRITVFIPTETINRTDGAPALGLSVFKEGDANTVDVFHLVAERISQLEDQLGSGDLRVEVAFEQATFIEDSIDGVAREGGLGAFFAVVVILVFLSGFANGRYRLAWRSTLVTAVSMPLSVLAAFAGLKWIAPLLHQLLTPLGSALGEAPLLSTLFSVTLSLFPENFTLNIMTLSGMTVAIGRVVDDSIVVLENITRRIQQGEDRMTAALKGTGDVAVAILASTVTTVIVFLPVGLLGGYMGEFFMPFGVAVTYALGASFVVAVTIVPLLAYMFIRREHLPPEGEDRLQRIYTPALDWALGHRWITLAVSAVTFAGGMLLLSGRPRTMVPEMGAVYILAQTDLPAGTTMHQTNDLAVEFERRLRRVRGLETILTEVGSGGYQDQFIGAGVDQTKVFFQIGMHADALKDALTGEVRRHADNVFGPENVTVTSTTVTAGSFADLTIIVSGDPQELAAFNGLAIEALESIDGLANVTSSLSGQKVIVRVEGQSAVSYSAEMESEDMLGLSNQAKAAVDELSPASLSVTEGFLTRQQTEGFTKALRAIGIAIIFVYIVMVLTFRSIVHPFTILFSLPLAAIGAAVALWAADRTLGLPAMVGLMMLVGIVVTNAIVLVDRVQHNRTERGMDTRQALREGGRTRLRPILMTALAAMLALAPLAMGFSSGAIIAAELAAVVIGGLFTSTLLTLLVVPVMYSLLDGLVGRRS